MKNYLQKYNRDVTCWLFRGVCYCYGKRIFVASFCVCKPLGDIKVRWVTLLETRAFVKWKRNRRSEACKTMFFEYLLCESELNCLWFEHDQKMACYTQMLCLNCMHFWCKHRVTARIFSWPIWQYSCRPGLQRWLKQYFPIFLTMEPVWTESVLMSPDLNKICSGICNACKV